jgi:flavin reductase (DIM6/NTAB) family NADH-FMN oxidoreductase RutF
MKFDPDSMKSRAIHELLVGCVTPRPIAFVSTIGKDGVYNVAPFSFFTIMSICPAVAGFAIGRKRGGTKKDTLVNIEFSGEYVINVVTESMARSMNQAAGDYPSHVDEFKETGLTPVASDLVRPPRVDQSPIQLECKLLQIMELGVFPSVHNFVAGEILRIHVRDDVMIDGVIRAEKVNAIGRLGEDFYCLTQEIFEMKKPLVPAEL